MRGGLARWRVRAGYPAVLLYFWLAHPRPAWLAVGAIVAVAGLAIRALAAGHLRKHEGLATAGPYAWTRNPLYFGSMWMAAGLAVASHSWLAGGVVVAYFLAFYPATMRSEEAELAREYGDAFRDYASRVPLFWPRPPRVARPARKFSVALYRRNHEYNAALGTAVVLLLLVLKMIWLG
jgi:protein-S-isoprenylcysteine O-methyltransferase Ste14